MVTFGVSIFAWMLINTMLPRLYGTCSVMELQSNWVCHKCRSLNKDCKQSDSWEKVLINKDCLEIYIKITTEVDGPLQLYPLPRFHVKFNKIKYGEDGPS